MSIATNSLLCPWCKAGFEPIGSSVTEALVHPDTPVGRVVCTEKPIDRFARKADSSVGQSLYAEFQKAREAYCRWHEARYRSGSSVRFKHPSRGGLAEGTVAAQSFDADGEPYLYIHIKGGSLRLYAVRDQVEPIPAAEGKPTGLEGFTPEELTIGKGVTKVTHLPYEAPWMNPFGACLINISAVRRDPDGKPQFQLAGEDGTPYSDPSVVGNDKTVWVYADAFYDEWPQ